MKDKIKEVENILKGYRDLLIDIDITELKIEEVEEEYRGCEGIEYKETIGATNKFNSTVENEVIERERRLLFLKEELEILKKKKKKVDRLISINELSEVEKMVIELRYINKRVLRWREIGYTVHFSEGYCRRVIQQKAIAKMARHI